MYCGVNMHVLYVYLRTASLLIRKEASWPAAVPAGRAVQQSQPTGIIQQILCKYEQKEGDREKKGVKKEWDKKAE
jgi:hypothetical protein